MLCAKSLGIQGTVTHFLLFITKFSNGMIQFKGLSREVLNLIIFSG